MARIEFTDAAGRPQRYEIPEGTQGVVLGRSPSCHCVIANHSVGRNHGRITFESGRFVYVDLGSVNGSYLNDRKLAGPEILSDGDVIILGEVAVRFVQEARRATGASKPVTAARAAVEVESPRTVVEREPPPPAEPSPRRTSSSPATRPPVEAPRPTPTLEAQKGVASPDVAAARVKAEALAGTLAEREEEVRHLRGLIADGERRIKDAESRATMATSSLESMHAKYLDMRDQVSHLQSQLDSARSEASDREAEAAELREKVAALAAQVESIRGRTGQSAEEIGSLKVKLTERDRETERLRRELDGREYDLKTVREENERLEEYCKNDTGRQQELERKVRNLEAVIDENRNLIASLRRDIEKKEDELRKVRLGVGIADLEQEKTRLLEDYHRKNRELDEQRTHVASLNAEIKVLTADKEDLEGRIRALEDAAKARRAEREDISDHPEYRARTREVETLNETVRSLTGDLEALRSQADDLPELKARLTAEAAAATEKAKTLSARVDDLQAEMTRRATASMAAVPSVPSSTPADLAGPMAGVEEAVDTLADGLVVLQAGLKDTVAALEALNESDVPPAVRDALHGSSPGEMAESIRDVRRMIGEDLDALRKAFEAARRLWQPGR